MVRPRLREFCPGGMRRQAGVADARRVAGRISVPGLPWPQGGRMGPEIARARAVPMLDEPRQLRQVGRRQVSLMRCGRSVRHSGQV